MCSSRTVVWCLFGLFGSATAVFADVSSLADAITGGKAYINFNLRFESVEEANALDDAAASTLLTRLGYRTGAWNGLSAHIEFEDSRIVFGGDSFSVPPTGFNAGEFSVVADPETTELDQAYLQYRDATAGYQIRVGRQLLSYGTQRFIGAVPWRQDYQTFDGIHGEFSGIEKLTIKIGHLCKRNRIFAQARDIDSSDNLLDVTYKLSFGALGAYAYLLENDDAPSDALDTFGLRLTGTAQTDAVKVDYKLEYATQESNGISGDFDADYTAAELGLKSSPMALKLGFEVLGSDDANYGFATPLATLHKFNGWADVFLATPRTGLSDHYLSIGGTAKKFRYELIYHDFSVDSRGAGYSDLGDEINVVLTRPIGKHVFGVKYASYRSGDSAAGTVDTDRFWMWISAKFD